MKKQFNPFAKLARHLLEQNREASAPASHASAHAIAQWKKPLSRLSSDGQLHLSTKRCTNSQIIEADHVLFVDKSKIRLDSSETDESQHLYIAWFIQGGNTLCAAPLMDDAIPTGVQRARLPKDINSDPNNKKILVIINPFSGKGKSRSLRTFDQEVEPLLVAARISYETYTTQSKSDCESYLGQYRCWKDVEAIVSVGGDGLLHEIVNGILSIRGNETTNENENGVALMRRIRVGIIPAGTSNGVAYCRGHVHALDAALDIFEVCRQGDTQTSVTKRYGIISFSHAVLSYIDLASERMRAMGQMRLRVYAGMYILNPRSYHYHLLLHLASSHESGRERKPEAGADIEASNGRSNKHPTIRIHTDLMFFSIFNIPYIQPDVCCVPASQCRMDDGLLHVVVVPMDPASYSPVVMDANANTHANASTCTNANGNANASTCSNANGNANSSPKRKRKPKQLSRLQIYHLINSFDSTASYLHQFPNTAFHYQCTAVDLLPCRNTSHHDYDHTHSYPNTADDASAECQYTETAATTNPGMHPHKSSLHHEDNPSSYTPAHKYDTDHSNERYYSALDGETFHYIHFRECVSIRMTTASHTGTNTGTGTGISVPMMEALAMHGQEERVDTELATLLQVPQPLRMTLL